MKLFTTSVRCAWCGKLMTHHYAPGDQPQAAPEDGDSALCVGCGEFSIFDHEAPDGVRRPSPYEAGMMKNDPYIARMKMAWRKVALPPRKTRH